MNHIAAAVAQLGGVARTRELRVIGFNKWMLAVGVASGRVTRHRVGHYSLPSLPAEVTQSLRIGGRPCCVTAAKLYGLRALVDDPRLHVSVGQRDSRFRSPSDRFERYFPSVGVDAVLHWKDDALCEKPRTIVGVEDCVVQLLRCLPRLDAIVTLDSALEIPRGGPRVDKALVEGEMMKRIYARLSADGRAIADEADGRSQAVGETVARVRFREAGIPVRIQVPLPGGFIGDLGIGRWLIVECDGEEPHTAPGAFDRGLARDAWLAVQGHHVIHFSHRQIVNDWPHVLSTTVMLMRRGVHLHPF